LLVPLVRNCLAGRADIGHDEAIEIVLSPRSLDAILGERSARTVSRVIQQLADAGEARFLIVTYAEQVASSRS
jgi:hypothetical protein